MAIQYLKKADPPVQAIDTATSETVRRMLEEIKSGGEEAVRLWDAVEVIAGSGVSEIKRTLRAEPRFD